MKPITTTNYYRIKFDGITNDIYEYGETALDAINIARRDLTEWDIKDIPTTLGNATARPAVYGEWKRELTHSGSILL